MARTAAARRRRSRPARRCLRDADVRLAASPHHRTVRVSAWSDASATSAWQKLSCASARRRKLLSRGRGRHHRRKLPFASLPSASGAEHPRAPARMTLHRRRRRLDSSSAASRSRIGEMGIRSMVERNSIKHTCMWRHRAWAARGTAASASGVATGSRGTRGRWRSPGATARRSMRGSGARTRGRGAARRRARTRRGRWRTGRRHRRRGRPRAGTWGTALRWRRRRGTARRPRMAGLLWRRLRRRCGWRWRLWSRGVGKTEWGGLGLGTRAGQGPRLARGHLLIWSRDVVMRWQPRERK